MTTDMPAIIYEISHALNRLWRSPGFTVLAVVILGFGLGATVYMFTIVKAYVLTPLPYPGAERIMHLERANPTHGIGSMEVTPSDYIEWRRAQQSFEALAAFSSPTSRNFSDGDWPERVDAVFITPSVFDIVQADAHIGRTLMPEDAAPGAPPVVVIGYDVWLNRYNGDPTIVGETVRVDGVETSVVGVMPAGFEFPISQDAWLPMQMDLTKLTLGSGRTVEVVGLLRPGVTALEVVGRLRPGVTLEQARAEFANIAAALAAQYPENRNITTSIKPFHHEFVVAETRAVTSIMFVAVLFVLLIACANVANLILARTVVRQKDIALRAALGASRWRTVVHILTESLVLAFAGAVIGWFLADYGLELTRRVYATAGIEEPFWVVLDIDWKTLLFMAFATVATGVIAGLAPALRATRTDVNAYLKEGSKGSGASASRQSRLLVTAEIALSCILLVCSGLAIESVANIDSRPLGIENTNLLMGRIGLPEAQYPDGPSQNRFFEQLIERLQAHPGVIDATAAYSYPGIDGLLTQYRRRGTEVPESGRLPVTQYAGVMDNYAEALGLRLTGGRWFDARDSANSEPVVIVDKRFAAEVFPGEGPIGRQVALGDPDNPETEWRTVVGVTEAVFMDGIDDPERPAVLVPLTQAPEGRLTVAVHTRNDPMTFAQTLRKTASELDSDIPVYWVRTYDDWVWAGNLPGRRVSVVFSSFAVIAVVLAAAGIYGVLAYSVSRRTREIGMRRAMGARNGRILNMVLGQSMLQLAIGLGAGLLCAIGFARLLSSYLYGVTPFDPLTLTVAALTLFAVALFASLLPALRAMRVNPMEALRYE